MTNEEILKAAIEKAEKVSPECVLYFGSKPVYYEHGVLRSEEEGASSFISTRDILFSHSFAKAFWGDTLIRVSTKHVGQTVSDTFQEEWRYRLQQMVLEEDPIQYLAQFL